MAIGQHDPGAMTALVLGLILLVGLLAFVNRKDNEKKTYWRNRMIQMPTFDPHIRSPDMPPPPPTLLDPSHNQSHSLHPAQDAGSEKSALKVFEF